MPNLLWIKSPFGNFELQPGDKLKVLSTPINGVDVWNDGTASRYVPNLCATLGYTATPYIVPPGRRWYPLWYELWIDQLWPQTSPISSSAIWRVIKFVETTTGYDGQTIDVVLDSDVQNIPYNNPQGEFVPGTVYMPDFHYTYFKFQPSSASIQELLKTKTRTSKIYTVKYSAKHQTNTGTTVDYVEQNNYVGIFGGGTYFSPQTDSSNYGFARYFGVERQAPSE